MLRSLTARASATAAAMILALAAGAGPASAKNDAAPQNDGASGGTPGNPPGNNGSVKVDSTPFDDHPDNEPHVGCVFQIDFYNFDQGDLWADVSFDLHAPTGSGHLPASPERVFIGQDPAGGHDGGDDLDASQTYDLSAALASSGAQPHPQQGYHVKLTIHADGSQGADVKHKVFWIEPCGGAVPGDVAGETDQPGGNASGDTGGDTGGGNAGTPASDGSPEVAGQVNRPSDQSAVMGETFERGRSDSSPPAEVLGVQHSRGVLARTGLDLASAAGAGLVLVLMGLALRRTAARGNS